MFALLYRFLPRARPTWRAALYGAVGAAVACQAIQFGLSWYLAGPADFTRLYGSAGAVLAFLLFVYLSSMAFLVGALTASKIGRWRGPVTYGESAGWSPERPKIRLGQVLLAWVVAAGALLIAAAIVPGVHVNGFLGAVVASAVIAVLNAFLPPIVAALRLPFMVVLGFLLVLFLDAALLLVTSELIPQWITVDSFGWALLTSLIAAAVTVVLQVIVGTNDDDTFTFRIVQRIAKRQGGQVRTDVPGIIFLEIDGLALPVLRRALRDGNAPEMARWLQEGTHRLAEWETDFSSQTGASQAGILLGSNEDIPAFRWVEKETATMMTCSAPPDCEEIERRHATGIGLLIDGGASRGNLLSGEADEVILTVSRMEAEKRGNPGYRAFYANGFNVTRVLVLFFWEVVLELSASSRAARRDVRPRGHRGGIYPFMRAAMCVAVRDLIVYGVLTDMMAGRPAVYATFSSYDEVAHHSGLERSDTLEALRKLDEQFGRIDRARRYAPRPYEIVVLSDHGQTQGATFKQRNGYGLDELVRRSVASGTVAPMQRRRRERHDGPEGGRRGDRHEGEEEAEERRQRPGRDRARLGEPRPDLPDGGAAPAHARGAERAPSAPDPRAPRPPARRLPARPLRRARAGRPRRERHALPRRRPHRRARTRSPRSPRTRRTTCGAPTASRTSPTSW